MNVYDKAHELARALKLAPEVIEYKSAMEKINSNPNHKRMVEDFRKKQLELYSQQLKGVEPSKEQIDSLNNLLNIISLNPEIRNYLEAEMRFSRLWEDIMKILGDAMDIDFTEELIKK
ncbi:YlbF family regulator [Caloramator sp. E03]|uniref:YlbF family regulator n=1 Tax=Caloramator sp. E03 TaxID=2576307 RepID=UPI00111055F8|nr:YlbF family regulator [Caloramator sp. E03]QCX32730.1 YlbF family regulator [Caloramator sp. E03]